MLVIVGFFLAGLWTAALGAWKDTLWEPFSARKFFRTPIITVATGGLLLMIFGFPVNFREFFLYIFTAVALERFAVESWKALVRKQPSKFQRPQRDSLWLRERFSQIDGVVIFLVVVISLYFTIYTMGGIYQGVWSCDSGFIDGWCERGFAFQLLYIWLTLG